MIEELEGILSRNRTRPEGRANAADTSGCIRRRRVVRTSARVRLMMTLWRCNGRERG